MILYKHKYNVIYINNDKLMIIPKQMHKNARTDKAF